MNLYSVIAISLFASIAISSAVTVVIGAGDAGTQLGAGATNTTKDNLNAEATSLWGVSNSNNVMGIRYYTYTTVAGGILPSTIQAGTYTFSARIGNGNAFSFAGLNDIKAGTNTSAGSAAGFFTTVGASNNAGAEARKQHVYGVQ
ncbi:MAG: hypothetical protein NWT08_04200 [Akkermansiaceae bacterium]|nr:hypothetical protein [Akkermansiaceae bacterium]MDP4646080.1 hypothetical protein [Akkermansiaceae bacterium]MDP4720879.1 hypothetical protein [Akkermansiaceae bacterium]MDP4780762.1 hypothetical protein [Akkermansiaceae bacterium]MDP4845708.1 hypothetical protein [Akkermansiaceae bacterium]